MRDADLRPRVRVLVCVNPSERPDATDGCGAHAGPAVYAALRSEVARRGLVRDVWVTRTWCLGVCPDVGCTVELQPSGLLLRDVEPEDAPSVLDRALPVADAPRQVR